MGGATRREFAATSALAGATLLVKPSLVRGSEANSRIRTGMIGLGGRGSLIAQMLVDHAGFELVAACDYFKEVVDEKGAGLGVPEDRRFHTLSGYQGLIESELDAFHAAVMAGDASNPTVAPSIGSLAGRVAGLRAASRPGVARPAPPAASVVGPTLRLVC